MRLQGTRALVTRGAPRRIVCLTAETAEILYALGVGDRVVGVSSQAVRPAEVRTKPRIGGYTAVDLEKVVDLKPDLVLAYSDLQAPVVSDLVRRGLTVLVLNQRSLREIFEAVLLIGRIVGQGAQAMTLIGRLEGSVARIREQAVAFPRRPRVYFEEWDNPLICGIRWVSELIEAAGGEDIFADRAGEGSASRRVVAPEEVQIRNPEVILASWCGKKVRPERIVGRDGWHEIQAVRSGRIHEVRAEDILQPGPSVLRGLDQIHRILADWADRADGVGAAV